MAVGVGADRQLVSVARALELEGDEEALVASLRGLDVRALRRRTRAQLLAAAKALELRGVSRLPKEELARAVAGPLRAALAAAAASEPEPRRARGRRGARPPRGTRAHARSLPGGAADAARPAPAAVARLDLGASVAQPMLESIPWGYAQHRVTAAAADPDTLYVYWEVDDPAIERARGGLGGGGAAAWLNLRVYDTTGRIFDGTNANAYFDHGVDRSDRQWFFRLRRPGSAAVVEIGLKSAEGYFVRIARSGRVDFPRNERAPEAEPEWMTVVSSGEVLHAGRGQPRRQPPPPAPGGPPAGAPPGQLTQVPLWLVHETDGHAFHLWEFFQGAWSWREWFESSGESWFEALGRLEWEGPATVTTWEAGPFTYPVQVEPPRREAWQGRSVTYATAGGATRVVYGPWRVVIRNLGGHRRHAVLGRWEIYRSWTSRRGRARLGRTLLRLRSPGAGASELLLAGASERAWRAASELRLGGASELWALGASELRLAGASEQLWLGASQLVLRGASERRLQGASEWVARGASERRLAGGSELRLGGASERRLGGASEALLAGASERLGGASERLGGSEGRWPSPASAPVDGATSAPEQG